MKKLSCIVAVSCFLLLTTGMSSQAAIATFSFTDTINSPTAPWTHVLDVSDFNPSIANLNDITINDADLMLNYNVTVVGYYGVTVATIAGDTVFLGNIVGSQIGTGSVTFGLPDTALYFLNDDMQFQVLYSLPVEGGITFSQSTLSGSAVPLPASVILLGTGLIGLVGFRRRSANKK